MNPYYVIASSRTASIDADDPVDDEVREREEGREKEREREEGRKWLIYTFPQNTRT